MKARASEIEAIVARPYARVLERGEDGVYTAFMAEVPGCIAEGGTPDQAIAHLDEAFTGIVRSMLRADDDIPDPLATREYSGRLMLRVPPSLHARAALYAALEGVSLNRLLSDAVAEHVGAAKQRAMEQAPHDQRRLASGKVAKTPRGLDSSTSLRRLEPRPALPHLRKVSHSRQPRAKVG